jgi:hypothetical protein
MPISPDTVSSPKDSAGEGGGLNRAFDAALESVDLDNAEFQPAAMDGEPVELDTDEPVDSETDEPAAPAKPAAKLVKAKPKDAAAPAVVAPAPLDPPANWDAKRKEAFAKLPPEGKTLALSMAKDIEAEFTRKSTELAQDRDFAKSIRSLVTDAHRQQMQAGGFRNEAEGIAHLVKLNVFATRDFPGYVRWAIGQSGMDPRQIFPEYFTGNDQGGQQPAQPSGQPRVDPIVQQVYQALAGRLQGIEQRFHTEDETAAAQAAERFRTATDEAGNPKYPHLDKVQAEVVKWLQAPEFVAIVNKDERLARAYDRAVRLDPDLYQQTVDAETQRRLADKRAADDLAKARKAKAPIRSTPTGPVKTKPSGLDGSLRDAFNLHGV